MTNPKNTSARDNASYAARETARESNSLSLADLAALIRRFRDPEGSALALAGANALDRPMRGQTLYLASCTLDLRQGKFRAHVFQDIIDKHYIIALAHGGITRARTLHARLHSSCVTSETLRACDCDCVEQLERALDIIAQKKRGILFYLMQEGRGVNYAAKARDRMLVQASRDRLTTFDAYAAMGLDKDHRHYDNISQICHLLGVRAAFILLTNNPDKVAALRAQGIRVARAEPLEVDPTPFNIAYLTSKATCGGHNLKRPAVTRIHRAPPPEPVTPFRPRALPDAPRYIYVASYFLPIKPVEDIPVGASLATPKTTTKKQGVASNAPTSVPSSAFRLSGLQAFPTPHWFRAHVYYDIVTSQETIVLTYGTLRADDAPVVRLHGESIFDRFPLRVATSRDEMKQSIRHIIAHGSGVLLLLHDDGNGASFGADATARMMAETEQPRAASTLNSELRTLNSTPRDYTAALLLLKHHIPSQKIQLILNTPKSLTRKTAIAAALKTHGLKVTRWLYLDAHPTHE